jgi:hypothetical protein
MLRQIGELSRADQAYIVDLWDKFGLTPFAAGQPREAVYDIGKDADTGSLSDTEAELQRAKATICQVARSRKASSCSARSVGDTSERAGEGGRQSAATEWERRGQIRAGKKSFREAIHPNAAVGCSPLEAMVRSEVFKEFWAELEAIESGSSTLK